MSKIWMSLWTRAADHWADAVRGFRKAQLHRRAALAAAAATRSITSQLAAGRDALRTTMKVLERLERGQP